MFLRPDEAHYFTIDQDAQFQTTALSRFRCPNWLAGIFSRAGIDIMERQTARLKKHREKLKKQGRDRDDFTVS